MRVVVIVGSRVGVESASEVVLVLVVIVVEAGDGSARVNSRSSRSRRTSGDSTSALQDADASVVCGGKKVLLLLDVAPAAWARERAVAAGVEDTAAWAGRKELSEGVWFRLNVVELGPGVADVDADGLSGVEGSSSCWVITCVSEEVAVDGSCMEERLSDVGMWTWAACSKKEVQN